jgi:hypothetical protein
LKECDGGIIINLLYWAHPQEEAQCGQKPERQRAEEGLAQGQDGRYSARFAARADKRTERYSHTLPEACSRQEDARYKGCAFAPFEMAADDMLDHDSPTCSIFGNNAWWMVQALDGVYRFSSGLEHLSELP